MAKPPDFVGTRGGKTKFQWSKGLLQREIGKAAAIALQKAGLEVRKQTQRGMVGGGSRSGRQPLKRPKFWKVGERNGYNMVAIVRQVPRPDKVSSWAPQAFLRNDIEAQFDQTTKSIVIGPSKEPWLNQLHEIGGTVPLYFVGSDKPQVSTRGLMLPTSVMRTGGPTRGRGSRSARRRGAYVGYMVNQPQRGAISLGTRKVRPRRYMEIGLLASMKKIPQQFRDTISKGSL